MTSATTARRFLSRSPFCFLIPSTVCSFGMTFRSVAYSGIRVELMSLEHEYEENEATMRSANRNFRLSTVLLAGSLLLTSALHSPEVSAATPARPDNSQQAVIIELFTSQGCSSCPPADLLLSKIGRERFAGGAIIPLAFHVDYWNRIGWTDPFSSRQWSDRQNRYAAVRRSSQVYTPQLLLNGGAQVVGNNERLVRDELSRQLKAPRSGSISIDNVAAGESIVSMDLTASLRGTASSSADVYVVIVENGVTTAVKSGENVGRRLVNDHIVRSLTRSFAVKSGSAAGKHTVNVNLDPTWRREGLGIVAFIQDPKTLLIQGASRHSLNH